MLRNTFVCDLCERGARAEPDSHNTHLIRGQNTRTSKTNFPVSSDTENSPYWQHAFSHNPADDAGDTIEHDQANPDYLSAERLKGLESLNEKDEEMYELGQKLQSIPKDLLTEEELVAIRNYAFGRPLKETARHLGVTSMSASRYCRSAIKKLQKHFNVTSA
jgi:DNA-directed RNA polymerase specialized sigma24 family protein